MESTPRQTSLHPAQQGHHQGREDQQWGPKPQPKLNDEKEDREQHQQLPKLEQGQVDWQRNHKMQEQCQQLEPRRWCTPGHGDQGDSIGGRVHEWAAPGVMAELLTDNARSWLAMIPCATLETSNGENPRDILGQGDFDDTIAIKNAR